MKRINGVLIAQIAIALYAAWVCRFVFFETFGMIDRYGACVTWIWMLPIIILRHRLGGGPPLLSIVALALLIVGDIGALNTVRYAGLALACGALLRVDVPWFIWMAAAVSWFPVLAVAINWTGHLPNITGIRLVLALVPTIVLIFARTARRAAT